jgi:hypothetical protein
MPTRGCVIENKEKVSIPALNTWKSKVGPKDESSDQPVIPASLLPKP